MDDILCPSCGKPNIAGAETCWNCSARLQPEDSSIPAAPDSNLPDWLNGLRDTPGDKDNAQPNLPESADEAPAETGEVPDWLARIRQQQGGESTEEESQDEWLSGLGLTPEQPAQPAADVPDWLKGEPEQAASDQDWLGALRDTDLPEETAPADAPQAAQLAAAQSGADDSDENWIKNLSDWQTGDSGAQAFDAPEAASPAASSDADLSDWLSQLPGDESTDAPLQNDASSGTTPGLTEWLNQLPVEEPSPATPAESEPLSSSSEAFSADLPDWLSQAPGEINESEQAEPPASGAAAFSADLPDWLNQMPGEEPQAAPPEPSTAGAAAFTSDLPDWLNQIDSEEGETSQPDELASAAESSAAFTSDLPDWLSQIPGPDDLAQSEAEPTATGGLPPFIGSMTDAPAPSDGETPAPPFTLSDDIEQIGAQPADDTPDWLKTFSANLQPDAADIPALDAGSAFIESPAFEQEAVSYESEGLPDWLNETAGEIPENLATAPESEADGLEAAQLPGWLQAMRPVESVLGEGNAPAQRQDSVTEQAGPLAGLVGALPGENLVTQYNKLPPYSARLQLTERQRANASLIEELLAEDIQPRPARAERSHLPQRIVRAVIAILFLLTLLFPLVTGTQIMPLPDLYPPETVAFHGLVEQLPAGAPVLLAVDYEPALSGEMNLAASPVVDHLMARDARLAVVSTAPVGPVLADSLLRAAHTRSGDYALDELSLNLGYLPGGTAGLQEFASRPQVALPYTHDGKRMAWSQPALAGVTKVSEFALVIVLTENAETARAWIEQVQPSLDAVPLLFVVSAQSAPFLQPYLDSGQVQAMVSGMAGGSMYAQITQQPGLGRTYWDAYQFGLFLAALLILAGGLIALFSSSLTRRPGRKGA